MDVTIRRREAWLLQQVALLLVFLAAGLAGHRLTHAQPACQPAEVMALVGYLAGCVVVHHALCRLGILGDESIWPTAALLSGLGLLLRLRLAKEPFGLDDLPALLAFPLAQASLIGAVWVCRQRVVWLDRLAWLSGLLAVGLMALLVAYGQRFRGVMFGPGLTTPSEVLKPLLVVFLAGFLKRRRSLPELLSFVVIWGGVQVFLVRQSDLGMVVILGALLLSMFYVATGRTRYLLGGLAAAALLGVTVWFAAPLSSAAGRSQQRMVTWLNPWDDPEDAGYQTLQALFAMRAGGWEGRGLGGGQPGLVPVVESDFAYAALAEELGLLGTGLVLLLYLALLRRGFRIANLAEDPFRQRLAVGCVTVLAIQTLINVGGVVRWLPLTGITLPLISHGGSSLVVCHALLGIVLAVGHDVELGEPRPARRPVPRAGGRGDQEVTV